VSDPEKDEAAPAPATDDAGDAPETGLEPVEVAPGSAQTPEPSPAELQAEVLGLKQQLLRKRADFENYRRRTERDRQAAWNDACVDVFRALVPTLDNLERALSAEGDLSSLREGVQLILRELLSLLEARGVSSDDPTGRAFDPERHQALSQEAVPGAAPGSVVETFRKGYLFKDRLLRPALVKVAKDESAPSSAGPSPELSN
jgi:molecular chaperone GrpE